MQLYFYFKIWVNKLDIKKIINIKKREEDCCYGELSKQNALTVSVGMMDVVVGRFDICVFHPSPGGEIIGPF